VKLWLAALLVFPALAQQPCAIGSIERITPSDILMRNGLRLFLDASTEIVKPRGRELKPGEEVSIRCSGIGTRRPTATKIWANAVDFAAVVRYVNPNSIEVVTLPRASSAREERKVVALYPGTAFATSKEVLTVGQELRIVGIDVGDGNVDAIRVTIYNTDLFINRLK
jgi:hypothetical protein